MDAEPPKRVWRARLVLAVILTGAAFGLMALADEVGEGGFSRIDHTLLLALRHADFTPVGPAWLPQAARDVSALGGFTLLTLLGLAAILTLWRLGRRAQAVVFLGAVTIAQLVGAIFKAVIDRPRPDFGSLVDYVHASSFPSGHATMAPAVYLSLAALLARGFPGLRVLIWAMAGLIVVLVGISRVYLGVHWPTDVLAGWILGSSLALATITALRAVE
ncbi:MAG: PA-phosphatase [Caulobacteraceae bacterium]|nr:PA-phosphatase [Caulobacteraceae bacterium]